MPFDFPNPPLTVGQITTGPGGIQWVWDGVKWTVPAGTSTALTNTYTNVGRNIFHNGLLNIQQRGAGGFAGNGAGAYGLDRWIIQIAGSDTNTMTGIALTDADRTAIGDEAAVNAMQIAFTGSAAAGSGSLFSQKTESVRRTSGKTVTVSFWAKASTGTPRIGVGYYQMFGSGGSPSAAYTLNMGVTSALSATWQRYTITGVILSAAGKTFGTTAGTDWTAIEFWLSDGANSFATRSGSIGLQSGTVQLWGIQLEFGSAVTPLEKLDPRLDLANCQRFYYQGCPPVRGVMNSTTAISRCATLHPVPMRAAPTLVMVTPLPVYDGSTTSTFTSLNANYCTAATLEIEGTVSSALTAKAPAVIYQQAGGLLTVSADL